GESAKYWLAVLTELKNRGVADIFFLVCDGLKGLPDSVSAVFPDTVVQTCIIHLIRGTFRYAGASTTPRSPGRSSRSTPRSTLLRPPKP
ncbi:transposase, Mutator family protein, partial [Mycobacterium ulcerans str. Harvey]